MDGLRTSNPDEVESVLKDRSKQEKLNVNPDRYNLDIGPDDKYDKYPTCYFHVMAGPVPHQLLTEVPLRIFGLRVACVGDFPLG